VSGTDRPTRADEAFHLPTPGGRGLPGWAEAHTASAITATHIAVWRRWWRMSEEQPLFEAQMQGRYLLRQVRWARVGAVLQMSPELLDLQRGARRGLYVPRGVAPVVWGLRRGKGGPESIYQPVARFMVSDLGDAAPISP